MGLTLMFSIFAGAAVLCVINLVMDLRLLADFRMGAEKLFDIFIDSVGRHNIKRFVYRLKKEKIEKRKETVIAGYNNIIEGIIYDFNLPLTLEGANSLLCILLAALVLIIVVFLKNVSLSVLASVSILVGMITFVTMQSRLAKAAKLESIMDAEDLICPLARDGVLVAIKKVLESEGYLNKNIRPYFMQFVDNCENHGYSFKRAMEILNKQLGPKFDNFTKKAVIFEYNERKGMADIFLDIVDENAVLREVNVRKNRIFKKMNRDFLIKTAMIAAFAGYSMTSGELKAFMMGSAEGRLINTIAIVAICLSFARCQSLQSDIGSGGGVK
ncbi:hypothetical protein DFR58_10513 [Anaerobacterium chartisolvens]|uniref:Uncharacterized protein n=1 Tax=Anaerobacterium chartisolvens TaxID=1297424 RepID=A0A369BAB2_9FIRM|nr:hypothetical protein [Anaerobacterium chartisolvens]RCX18255.1 hypothetical protein DFR58_10513 [Anaerobacterium chartisolvens]